MKRLFAVILTAVLLLSFVPALAEVDLSGMSLDELITLKQQVNLEIWTRAEAKAVTVPQGTWLVGVDIPAGTYTLKCADLGRTSYMMQSCQIRWGKSEPVNGVFQKWTDRLGEIELYNPNNEDYKTGRVTEYTVTFEDGVYIYINPAYNKVTFYPYTGKPDLGFEW